MVGRGSYTRLLKKQRKEKRKGKEEKSKRPSSYFVVAEERKGVYVMPSWRQNMPGLNSRKVRISFRESHLGFHNCWCCSQSYMI